MRIWQWKMPALLLAVAGLCGPALAGAPAGTAPASTHHTSVLPAALRPALYQALAKDAGTTYRIGKNGCATLPKSPLKACFDRHGAHFSSDDALALRLAAYGRGGKLTAVKSVKPIIEGNQVSYPHGALTAWWRALPMGFEQGFTITKRPDGNDKLILALAASRHDTSALSTRHSRESGNPAEHTLAWGKLRYGKLVVTDAKGKVIPSSLKAQDNRILITVNDGHATYPLTIDPLVWIEQKVTARGGADDDHFGPRVAIDGKTALVGAPAATTGGVGTGAVYIFTRSNGTWAPAATLNGGLTKFGASVALSGTTAFVGTPAAGRGADFNRGTVYVFTRSNGSWTQTQQLIANDGKANDEFGYSIALSDGIALIGAPYADPGAVYVFVKSNGEWIQTAKLTATDGNPIDSFGASVALETHTALIGAPLATENGHDFQGAAYVFTESGGSWSEAQRLTSTDGAAYDRFGFAVALDNSTALVGAPVATVGNNYAQGAVYVFHESAGTWTQRQKLAASDGIAEDRFGSSVALDNAMALVGAPDTYLNGNLNQGTAYIFAKTTNVWQQAQKLTASDGMAHANFGASVALSDAAASVLVNAPFADNYEGAAYFYDASDLSLAVSAPVITNQGQSYVSQTIATNNSSTTSPAVAVTMVVPAAASLVSATATQGNCSEDSDMVTCEFGAIDGNAGTATANVTLKATGDVGATIYQVAGIAKATPALTANASTVIKKANSPPVAENGSLTTKENTPATGTFKATDPDGDALTFSIVDKPTHGSVKLDDASIGGYTYKPDQGYSGSDSFTFKANDGQADSNTAKITITIKAVNQPPVAADGTLTTTENTAASGTLQASDPDGDHLAFAIVTPTAHGEVDLGDNGAYTYTPNHSYSGRDSFTFKANDGQADSNVATISITVKAASPPPPPSGGGGGATGPLGLGLLGLAALLAFLSRRH